MASPPSLCIGPAADLMSAFVEFASFGSRSVVQEIDGAKFFKLCKETGLIDRRFTVIDVDLIFAKVPPTLC